MASATVDGLTLAYEVIGEGRPWVITPGGRFTKDEPGVRELANALAAEGNRVLIWDRPNCGESDVCFTGDSESAMQADALAGLLQALDMAPAVIIGGSGGARVSMLAAARHPEVAAGLAVWWISGGVFGTHVPGHALLRQLAACGVDGRHGGRRRAAGMGRGSRAKSIEPATVPRPGPAGVRRHVRAMDARVLPLRRRAGARSRRRRLPASSTFPRSCSAAARATPSTRARPRSGSRSCSRTRSSSSPPGATGSGSSAKGHAPQVEACSRAGHCSRRRC